MRNLDDRGCFPTAAETEGLETVPLLSEDPWLYETGARANPVKYVVTRVNKTVFLSSVRGALGTRAFCLAAGLLAGGAAMLKP